MNDAGTPPSAPPPAAGLLAAKITSAAAVLGTLFAVGQSGSALIQGYIQSHTQIELEKLKTNSDVFDKYFQLAFGKETTQDNNVILLGALAEIDGHPLQNWARERYKLKIQSIKDVDAAEAKLSEAQDEKDQAQRHVAMVSAKIKETTAYLVGLPETPDARKPYLEQQKSLTIELALANAEVEQSKANTSVASQRLKIISSSQSQIRDSNSLVGPNEYLYVDKLSVDVVKEAFPGVKVEFISKHLPFLKVAMKEFHLSSPELIAATLAIIKTETTGFVPISEAMSSFNTQNTPFDRYEPGTSSAASLGNKEPGDGPKFKGRGFVQITGRNNYAKMDELLGLGSRLIESPDDMNDPDVAARVLCAFVATKQAQISTASQSGDMASMRRAITGGTHGVAEFTQAYVTIMSSLSAPTKAAAVTANSSGPP